MAEAPYRWYWRRYRTPSGGDPVGEFLHDLPADNSRALANAMRLMRGTGVRGARHLRGDLYEVRAQTAKLTTDSSSARNRDPCCWHSSRTTKTPRRRPAASWSSRNGGLPIGDNERSRESQPPTG